MEIPVPGQPVRGSRSGAPIMALFDLLGRRWAMGVLWTLCETGPTTFRNLQERCETISPAVLNQRLKELHAAKFVEKSDRGYVASPLGLRVYEELVPLGATARHWAGVLASMSATSR
jgi:DNA-binding HxlR family transcriptional regulator